MSSLSSLQINKRFGRFGKTPLMLACEVGADRRIIEILIEAGGEVGANDFQGDTALHLAVFGHRLEALELLLSRGSRVNPRDVHGQTPLHWACSLGYFHTVDILLGDNGIDANVVNNDGDTPLHAAVQKQRYVIVSKMLSKCCTSLNMKTEERLSGVVVARYLANQGADFHQRNNNNNTPLDLIKDPNLRKKLETFLPPQCLLCRNKTATIKFLPCGHFVTCETCSKISHKRCLKCGKLVTSRTGDGRELGIKQVDLNIIRSDFPNDTAEQGFQMLYKWFQCCDPANRTLKTLTEALKEFECFDALECLSLDTN
ncbi:ankyrin repeat RF_0381 [Octopus vulgaris]|uniref:Ankyrin repeat RF_0381 n=1 Tax=Octopus vulgaris TaxID=6645 RepID=A0AA36AZA9_OCTVU|nr:ankyrin repeat RF_0381 [Octopus vulgaris]